MSFSALEDCFVKWLALFPIIVLRVLSATLILSKNSSVLQAKSRLKSANLSQSRLKSAKHQLRID